MEITLAQVFIALISGVGAIVFLTVFVKLHPFFALLIACIITGLLAGIPFPEMVTLMKAGMGDILSKLTLIIVLGTALGMLLEQNGSTRVMADVILSVVGEKRAAFATALTGFIVGMPIFCDSGYIVLNGLNQSLARRTRFTMAQTSISLAAGLYAVHCLIPPHPGATAAASTIGADMGKLVGWGIVLAIPIMLTGYAWAVWTGNGSGSDKGSGRGSGSDKGSGSGSGSDNGSGSEKGSGSGSESDSGSRSGDESNRGRDGLPSAWVAFLPVILPIVLMAVRSILSFEIKEPGWFINSLIMAGEPAVALAIGVVVCLAFTRNKVEKSVTLGHAVEKAGSILIIIAGGAAFGGVIAATHPGEHLGNLFDLSGAGWFFPFLLAALIKTAQGSSTVAIVTASSIILPLLPTLGLDTDNGRLLAVLSLGVGSMVVSHTNDAYFWVIARFSDLDVRTMLRVHTVGTLWMGLTGLITLFILHKILL